VQIQGYRDNKVPLKGYSSLEWIDGTVFCAIRRQDGLIELFFAFGWVLYEKNVIVTKKAFVLLPNYMFIALKNV